MSINENDSRVRRTKKLIRQGLVELAKNKSISKITVKELTDCVDINRGTFYLHYKDVYDLVESIENELYDEFNAETDENKRLELIKKINEVSLEAAQYGATNDFANLTEGYGGDNLNAFTSYDLTAYFNTFPAGALEKWLEINSERLLNPVFRSFQAELENVYEEFNMYQDDLGTHQRTFLFGNIYKGTPYERDVIGFQHHLKNPSLSKLIEFFQTWYVPNNMCLMLVGNFDAESAKPLIAEKFGRLQPKELPARAEFVDTKIEGTEKFKAKLGYTPQVYWVYPGVKKGDKDELALSVALQLLNNGHNTGLLDKLMLDNTLSTAYVSLDSRREAGRIMVVGVPYYDVQQSKFETFTQTQRYITKEIDKLRSEQTIPDWLFKSVKDQLLQSYTTQFESTDAKVNMITYSYAYAEGIEAYLKEDEAIRAITKADVVRVINQYLPKDAKCMTLEMTEGDPKKNKLAKPAIKPLNPPKGVFSILSANLYSHQPYIFIIHLLIVSTSLSRSSGVFFLPIIPSGYNSACNLEKFNSTESKNFEVSSGDSFPLYAKNDTSLFLPIIAFFKKSFSDTPYVAASASVINVISV